MKIKIKNAIVSLSDKSKIDLLGEMILANRGEDIRREQTAIMSRGDTLEPVLLNKAGEELGLDRVYVDIEEPIIVPYKNALLSSYPNPFNPVVTIPFELYNNELRNALVCLWKYCG